MLKRLLLALSLCVCLSDAATAGEDLVIGVTPFPHHDIMNVVKELMAKDGYNLVIRDFTDYIQPNTALAENQLFANFFQHIPYFDNMNEERGLGLAWIAKVHIEPLGLYSRKIASLDDLKDGNLIAVPNDPTNEARALRLLEENGLITLNPGELVTVRDITDNPRGLRFRELDAAQLPRTLDDVTASVINTNFAGEAGLNPAKDAIIIEGKDSPYANVVVVRAADVDTPAAQALKKASQSPEVRKYIEDELVPRGIVPAF
ncbi:MAG: MetQ/NlpA family ABC transporter substrate-binding protein [Planctomycetaceae bacterium]|nr:MetQ/NlpA family ABC transporter substrate-binding protein [Planctomycetaceae bacterium]